MLDLGKLKISIEVDNSKATKDLAKTKGDVKGVGDSAENAGGKFSSMKAKVAIAAAAVVAIGAVAIKVGKAIKKLADETAAYGDEVDKQSQKMQISKEAYQEWSYIAERSGTTITSMAVGMKVFRAQINANSKSFKELGVSVKDSNGKFRDTTAIYQDTMYALADLTDSNKKYQLAQEIFGKKTAAEILPMLNGGSKAMKELQDRAEALGFVMSDETVKACADYQDAMTDVNKSLTGLKNNIIAVIIPGMAQFASKLADGIGEVSVAIHDHVAKEGAIGVLSAIAEIARKALFALLAKIPDFLNGIADLINQMADKLAEGDTEMITKTVELISNIVVGIIKATPKIIAAILNLVKSMAARIKNTDWKAVGKAIINGLLAGLKAAWSGVLNWVSDKVNWIKNKFKSAADSAPSGKGHRIGLNEVPFDGYTAVLHKGERVLTAAEVNQLNAGNLNGAQPTQNMTVNFNGNYSFMNEKQIDYFMKQAEKMMRRRATV